MKYKCLLLFSGGLDSMISAKILEEEGVKVTPICFESFFFSSKQANPCIDCHLMMIKEAGKIMKKEGFDFIATGEVLGQRPMSQNANALKIIDKWSGLDGLIVRPLSAKLLPPTILGSGKYSISGKSREMQLKLAKKFKIKNYPSPAGGCILTDINYGKNIKRLMDIYPSFGENDILILRCLLR
ncbi:MAG: Putative tRNA, (5-methylaminomethyl-2-thiouridylate)-methyltransferase [Parcubacteria bacterium 34_609]|nr:MAG: Putative tRNA, (5-methylaminomethyl-2-thiouridylate)-methyltransferase [Parcubacteria bacterium 34_609]